MPTPIVPERTVTAHRGMDARNPPWLVDAEHAVLLENLEAERPGKRTRMRGVASIGAVSGVTSTLAAHGLWPFFDQTLGLDTLMGVYHGNLYAFPGTGGFVQRASGVSLTDTLHMNETGRWRGKQAAYVHSAQVSDSNASLASYLTVVDLDGGFSQNVSMAPRVGMWWQGRLWVADNAQAQDGSTLWWSSLDDGLSFSNSNTIRVESGRGGRITGLLPLRSGSPRFLVFKQRLIATVEPYWGSSSSLIPAAADALDTIQTSVRVVVENAGCVAQKSIQYIAGAQVGDIMFLSGDGFRAISRAADDTVAGVTLPLSATIQEHIDRINFTHAAKATSAVWNQFYHCAVPLDGATQNTHILSFDLINGGWYINTLDGVDLVNERLNQNSERLWLQSNQLTADSVATGSGGLVTGYHVFQTYTGDVMPGGSPVPYREVSRAYTFGSLDVVKTWDWVSLHAYNLNTTCVMDVWVQVNNDSAYTVGTFVVPPAGGNSIILGATPLPWFSVPNGVHMAKLSLADVPPGYFLQIHLTQTGTSDFSRPTILQTVVAAHPLEPVFDNKIS